MSWRGARETIYFRIGKKRLDGKFTLSGLLVGYVADWYGWTAVFETIIVVAVIGAIILISMWRAPRDGYAKAASINYED